MSAMATRCKVMGILNVTPDSFSDGGKFYSPKEAVRRAANMIEEGADIVDIGGESTRPGSIQIGWEEEWRRISVPLAEIVKAGGAEVSVDTYHPETAERALDCGAGIVNCVYADPVPEMARLCGRFKAALVAPFDCIVPEDAGAVRLYRDPMIGFGTTRERDLELLRGIPRMAAGCSLLVGASRKRIVKRLVGANPVGKTLGGNVAIAAWCALSGVAAVRVHDVRETVEAIAVAEALGGGGWILSR